ncbi:MAG: hypothetical protein R3296_13405 [Oleiphilaceae bacterium]|nr:hypothetical protein [Oleiphilaceae bacterium]
MIASVLLGIFLIHLAAFAALGMKRRQYYYLALVVTFSLLSASLASEMFAPQLFVGQDLALHQALRMCAWLSATVSVGWTVQRLIRRAQSSD